MNMVVINLKSFSKKMVINEINKIDNENPKN